MHSYWLLNQVVHILTSVFKRASGPYTFCDLENKLFYISNYNNLHHLDWKLLQIVYQFDLDKNFVSPYPDLNSVRQECYVTIFYKYFYLIYVTNS
jgi:hypothetical protein